MYCKRVQAQHTCKHVQAGANICACPLGTLTHMFSLKMEKSEQEESPVIAIKEEEIELLLEYKGSKCVTTNSTLCLCTAQHLRDLGEPEAVVCLSDDAGAGDGQVFLLQKWSVRWNAFVNVERLGEVCDGDRISAVPKPVSTLKVSVWVHMESK